jgi:hypothetical protein
VPEPWLRDDWIASRPNPRGNCLPETRGQVPKSRNFGNWLRVENRSFRKSRFSGLEKLPGYFFPSELFGFGGLPVTFVNTTSSCFGQK